ncbi:carboxypeptidase-like regulatory domain-containing protein [Candidatus Binatus soli]|jgi:carboxypeptidase family protein|uniref:carboxypeptidase-like regulatory domain-containing protein n=1 Tax=Candidatus Binatus soli TaxID=1953413 RepID=UPI003D0FD8C4
MNKSYIGPSLLTFLCLALTPAAFCSDITGKVLGPQGPMTGAQITVTNSNGNVVGQGTTNALGRYCITGLRPGNYKTSVNPPAGTSFKPGTVNDKVPAEGETEDWSLSYTQVAAASNPLWMVSANPPGACGGAYFGGIPDLYIAGGALGAATGGGFGVCVALGCFGGGGGGGPSPVVSSSR